MEYLSVDRISQGIAVCEKEDMSLVEIPLNSLPNDVKEGSVLSFENGVYKIDKTEEEQRKKRIMMLQNLLFEDD
ncbi:MAG: DUF3006 domain-containing protein [Clostridia bacterium]|nr:DUF3006 domain-containing protein [Clostridia bacterium]